MENNNNKVRVNINISQEIKDWYQKQGEAFGCAMSSMMTIALATYKQQSEGLGAMKELGTLFEKIEEINAKLEEDKK